MKFNITTLLFLLIPFIFLQDSIAQSQTIAIKDVTVVNVIDGSLSPSQTVILQGNRIIKIGDSIEIPKAQLIEAKGKFLIPGLWDMHSHWIDYNVAQKLYLANGVTGLRELNGNFRQVQIMDSLWNEEEPVTRFHVGHLIDGVENRNPNVSAMTPAEAISIIDSLVKNKASFIKPYSSLKPDVFQALMDRANELGLPAAGHVPDLVHTLKAAELGLKSIEHSAIILKDCNSLSGELYEEYLNIMNMDNDSIKPHAYVELMGKELSSFKENICREIAKSLSAYGTAVTPTLITMYKHWYRPLVDFHKNPNSQYMPEYMRKFLRPDFAPYTEEEWKIGQSMHPINKKLVKILNEEGVMLLAGTDPGFPGFELHEELELLVEAGLTPLEALQTATLNPAIFLEQTDDLGTIEIGKLADLVLLNANPLEDISNMSKIHGVIMDGTYLDRNRLDEMLQKVLSIYQEK